MNSLISKIALCTIVIGVAVCLSSSAYSPKSSEGGHVIIAGGNNLGSSEDPVSPDITPCSTNFVVVIDDNPNISLVQTEDAANCDPIFQPSNSNTDTGTYTGVCMLALGTNCGNLTGGTIFDIILKKAGVRSTQIGTATLYCYNAGTNGCTNGVVQLTIPGGVSEGSFIFYSGCTNGCCTLSVCETNGGAIQIKL
jgi:hypothetical protein